MDPRAVLDGTERLAPIGIRSPDGFDPMKALKNKTQPFPIMPFHVTIFSSPLF